MSSQYTATVLEGKFKFNGGNRKIKATKTSLDGILATTAKETSSNVDKGNSFVEKLKAKNVELTRLTETGKCRATEGKAINVSSGMFKNEKENMEKIDSNHDLKGISLKMKEIVKEESTEDTNADSIIKALNIFETTNNLSTSTEEDKEAPSFVTQMTGEIDAKEESQPEVENEVEEESVVIEPTHESSGYLNEINAFKSQIGTDRFAEDADAKAMSIEPERNFKVHTNESPMRYNIPEPRFNESEIDADIEDFVRGYSNLASLSLTQIKNYKFGCDQYIKNAKAKKNEASQTINAINMQIEDKDAQIKELYNKINAIENEKDALMNDKQTWQGVYSEANTEESLGSSKMEEIDNFVIQEFNAMSDNSNSYGYGNYASSGYEGSDGNSHGRRAA